MNTEEDARLPLIQSTGSAQILADSLACDHDCMPGCDTCWLRTLCLPAAFTAEEIALLDDVIEDRHLVESRAHIYQAGQEFTSLFAIISGGKYSAFPGSTESVTR